MLSRQSVPCIRVHLLDGSSRTLSPSGTLDIRDILSRIKLLPNLLAQDFAFDDTDDVLYLADGQLKDIPPFPLGRRPPFFILHPHRNRLLFRLRSEAPELGSFWDEEGSRPLLTAPTLPRMKLMLKEQLYVQRWIDTLTSDNPPNHIPWACEKLASERDCIAEGCIIPAAKAKPLTERHAVASEHSFVTDTDGSSGLADQASHSRDLFASSNASAASIYVSTDSHTSTSHTPVKSADVGSGIPRGEPKTSQTPRRRIARVPQTFSPPELHPPEPPAGITKVKPSAPLAARRGRSLNGLKLDGSVIKQLEYPDIPTAFLGSPSDLSPRFDTSSVPAFTDHESMLLDLRSKCAALGSGNSTCTQEPLRLQPDTIQTSLSVDEWAFARGLATFADDIPRLIDSQYPGEIIIDTSIFLPDDSSTPANRPSPTARLEFLPHLRSTERFCAPPTVPLPPRPALVSPLTPPHVRGILKKVKSVRFEDTIIQALENHSSHFVPVAQISPDRPSPPPSIIPSERPRTPLPTIAKRSTGLVVVKEAAALEMNPQEKKPAPRPRLPPKRTKADGKLESVHPAPASSKPTLATAPVERPCRIAHLKENAIPVSVAQAQAKQKGLSIAETNVRRGIEGPTKNRLSVPLRNIFRFR